MTEHDLQLAPGSINVKLHKKLFPKKNTVLVMKDSTNQEDVFFVHKLGDLMEIGGHYTYYEKNPCMQNYMIASRKKNWGSSDRKCGRYGCTKLSFSGT